MTELLAEIERMETRSFDGNVLTTQESRFQWPLLLAVTFLALFLGLAPVSSTREWST